MNIFVCFSPFRCHDDPQAVSDSQVRTRRRAQAGGKVCKVDARGQQFSKVRLGKVRIDIPIQSWKLLLYLRQKSFPRIVIFLLCERRVLHFIYQETFIFWLRYFVATQDAELRARARKIAGTPILYLHHCAPTLEKPSEMSSDTAEADLERK